MTIPAAHPPNPATLLARWSVLCFSRGLIRAGATLATFFPPGNPNPIYMQLNQSHGKSEHRVLPSSEPSRPLPLRHPSTTRAGLVDRSGVDPAEYIYCSYIVVGLQVSGSNQDLIWSFGVRRPSDTPLSGLDRQFPAAVGQCGLLVGCPNMVIRFFPLFYALPGISCHFLLRARLCIPISCLRLRHGE